MKDRIDHARDLLGQLQRMPSGCPPYERTLNALLGDLISMIEAQAGGATVSAAPQPESSGVGNKSNLETALEYTERLERERNELKEKLAAAEAERDGLRAKVDGLLAKGDALESEQ